MPILGFNLLISSIHLTKCEAPPSLKSSLSTLVITTYFNFSDEIVFAKCKGSKSSGGLGLPCVTSQKGHLLVHKSPKIINVAVPWL